MKLKYLFVLYVHRLVGIVKYCQIKIPNIFEYFQKILADDLKKISNLKRYYLIGCLFKLFISNIYTMNLKYFSPAFKGLFQVYLYQCLYNSQMKFPLN